MLDIAFGLVRSLQLSRALFDACRGHCSGCLVRLAKLFALRVRTG